MAVAKQASRTIETVLHLRHLCDGRKRARDAKNQWLRRLLSRACFVARSRASGVKVGGVKIRTFGLL